MYNTCTNAETPEELLYWGSRYGKKKVYDFWRLQWRLGKKNLAIEINLKKHLSMKRSVTRIQNKNKICLSRALVVSIAKTENEDRYKSIVDPRQLLQTRLAHDLHEKRCSCRFLWFRYEIKQF